MKSSLFAKALCVFVVCCQVFTFTVTVKDDDESGDGVMLPTNIHVSGGENT